MKKHLHIQPLDTKDGRVVMYYMDKSGRRNAISQKRIKELEDSGYWNTGWDDSCSRCVYNISILKSR